jgi:hypothetical protein
LKLFWICLPLCHTTSCPTLGQDCRTKRGQSGTQIERKDKSKIKICFVLQLCINLLFDCYVSFVIMTVTHSFSTNLSNDNVQGLYSILRPSQAPLRLRKNDIELMNTLTKSHSLLQRELETKTGTS